MHSIFVAVSSTYTFVSTPRTWSDASADCIAHGAANKRAAPHPDEHCRAEQPFGSRSERTLVSYRPKDERCRGATHATTGDRQQAGAADAPMVPARSICQRQRLLHWDRGCLVGANGLRAARRRAGRLS